MRFRVEEIFRSIKGYEGLYEISNMGIVKSLERRIKNSGAFSGDIVLVKQKIRKLRINTDGYLIVTLSKDNKRHTYKVHLLVWDAFGDKPRDGRRIQVDHKDNNKRNNRFDNLQLLPNRENCSKGILLNKKNDLPIGVTWNKTYCKFYAQIQIGGKNFHLGTYNTPEEASQAYQDKLKELTK